MEILGKKSVTSFLSVILKAVWYLQIFAFVILTIIILALSLGLYKKPITMTTAIPLIYNTTSYKVDAIDNSGNLNANVKIEEALLSYTSQSNVPMILTCIAGLIGVSLFAAIVYLLRKIFLTLTENDPFTKDNTQRIKYISIIIMLFPILNFVIGLLINNYLTSHFLIDGRTIETRIKFDFVTLFLGFLILIISEVFNKGAQIQEENDLSI